MRFDKIEKVHEGAFIDRYNVSYTTQDQRKRSMRLSAEIRI